jgi:hypothetical protein
MSTTPAPAEPETPFTTLHWDGIMPSANGTIAKLFNQVAEEAQMDDTNLMADFIAKQEETASLNLDTSLVPFLIAIPGNTRRVRVLYGVGTGFGLKGIHENPLQENILALTGEAEDAITIPSAIILPDYTLSTINCKIPYPDDFETERTRETAGTPNDAAFWFNAKDVSWEAAVSPAVPVPAFLVYDGFDADIDPIVIYERVKSIPNHEEVLKATLNLLIPFLFATVVKTTKKDKTIRVPDTVFLAQPTALANSWKKSRLAQVFPTLHKTSQPTAEAAPAAPAVPAGNPDAEFIARIIAATRAADTANSNSNNNDEASTSGKKTGEDTTTFGLSDAAFEKLEIMCGVPTGCGDELPPLWKKLNQKNATKADKESAVRLCIQCNVAYKEAKVKPLHTLITMIAKRQFEGEVSLSTMSSATKGLTPFAVPCMTEAEVDTHNEMANAIEQATQTTVTDIKATKMKAIAPSTHAGLVLILKRFANLLFAPFGQDSPLFDAMTTLIDDLEDFNDTARENFTKKSIATVLWITHLQARHFAGGQMVGENAVLAEFQYMTNAICMKQQVEHGEVPTELYRLESQGKGGASRMSNNNNPPGVTDPNTPREKKQKTDSAGGMVNRDCYHPLIKQKLEPIFNQFPKKPLIRNMCTKAGTTQFKLFPNRSRDFCIKAQIHGQCNANCRFQHVRITDDEAKKALEELKPIIANPNLLKVN